MRTGPSWYSGTADAIYQNLYLLERSGAVVARVRLDLLGKGLALGEGGVRPDQHAVPAGRLSVTRRCRAINPAVRS